MSAEFLGKMLKFESWCYNWLKLDPEDKFLVVEPLLHGLAHEIRNPIQGILASAEALMLRFEEDGSALQLLHTIRRECVRVDLILGDLLNLVRPVEIARNRAFPLGRLLRDVARNFQHDHGTKARLQVEISDDLPLLDMDQESMQIAIAALLQNSLDSAKEGSLIRLAARVAGRQVEIRIEDNGEGIDPENFTRILQPFFSTRPGKAGLGLSIADRVVRMHNGNMEIQSCKGEGTAVIVRFPLQS